MGYKKGRWSATSSLASDVQSLLSEPRRKRPGGGEASASDGGSSHDRHDGGIDGSESLGGGDGGDDAGHDCVGHDAGGRDCEDSRSHVGDDGGGCDDDGADPKPLRVRIEPVVTGREERRGARLDRLSVDALKGEVREWRARKTCLLGQDDKLRSVKIQNAQVRKNNAELLAVSDARDGDSD